MRIDPVQGRDFTGFLNLAAAEGWLIPGAERILFRNGWSRHMFVLRHALQIKGYVSAVPHRSSGWIGNLIIDPQCRQQGFGSCLFDFAVDQLEKTGCREIWLTASDLGRPLYEKKGFRKIDRVNRWLLKGTGGLSLPRNSLADAMEQLCRQDRKAWGDCRRELIDSLARQGSIVGKGLSLALLQAGMERRVLGPWVSDQLCPDENRQLLQQVSGQVVADGELVSDVLASAGMAPLLEEAGFRKLGGTDLMVRSRQTRATLEGVVALASLGSIG